MDHLDAELVSVETHIEELEREINKLEEGDTKTSKKRKRQLNDEDKVRLDQERGYTIETLAKMSKSSGSKGEKVFRCVECAFQTPYDSTMADHVNSEHKRIPLECTECDYVCFKWKQIHLHRRKKHLMKGMKCPECNFKGVVIWQMEKHLDEKHDGWHTVEDFVTEYLTPNGERPSSEQLAPKPRGSKLGHRNYGGERTKHYSIKHDPETKKRSYVCIFCQHKNSRQFNILVHLNVEHFKTNLKCVWCEFTTLNEYSLNDHCKKEHGQTKKGCMVPGCGYSAIEERRFQNHLMTKHRAVYDATDHSLKVYQ